MYNYHYSAPQNYHLNAFIIAMMGTYMLLSLAVLAVILVSSWRIFEKAGKPGWAALVPFYNFYVLLEIVGRPNWWILFLLLSFVPFFGGIALFVVGVIVTIDLVKSFGKESVFAVLLLLLPFIGYPMLGFGDSKYIGPAALKASK